MVLGKLKLAAFQWWPFGIIRLKKSCQTLQQSFLHYSKAVVAAMLEYRQRQLFGMKLAFFV